MSRAIALSIALLLAAGTVSAQDADDTTPDAQAPVEVPEQLVSAGASPDQPKTMSGMSILGNEEAPKSLVIVPWKSSRLGDEPGLQGTLDERARPVDREVFMRELGYYEIRSGE